MIFRIALAASLAVVSTPLYAVTYTFEPNYTQGVFRWDHLGFSNPTAQFGQGEGTLEFDQAEPAKSSLSVTIPLASINSGVPALDDDLRSGDFFETAKFPTATFKSTRIEMGAAPDRLKVTGDLSLHGATKPVTLDVTINKVGENPLNHLPTAGFDATTTLKRSEFGLGKYVPLVSDKIQVHIISQAVEAGAYAEYLKAQAAKKAAAAKDAVSK
jgi:polyisoprenoid-binding protein YceI